MAIWCVVPVKPLKRAKSRLAGVLSIEAREALGRQMLMHTLAVLKQVPQVERTLVVSRDTDALRVARQLGAHTITESGAPELNAALSRATSAARGFGAHGVLVLPTDLPFLTPDDVEALLAFGRSRETVVIAPDAYEDGTNAMLVSPPGLIAYDYGPGSFGRHLAQARARSAAVHVVHLPNLMVDLDWPTDWWAYQARSLHRPLAVEGGEGWAVSDG